MASGSDSDSSYKSESTSQEYIAYIESSSDSDCDQDESESGESYFKCCVKDCGGTNVYKCCHCNEFFCKDHIIPVTESTGWNWNATKNFISFYCEACLIERRH